MAAWRVQLATGGRVPRDLIACPAMDRTMKKWMFFVIAALITPPAHASDHIDGPVTTSHRVADLTDLYAFPTADRPGFLTIILNAYPLVPKEGHFTDKVNYTIMIRRASLQEGDGGPRFESCDEVTLNCTFRTPEVTAEHVVRCRTSNGWIAQSRYQKAPSRERGGDFRLYAGMRADPFFFNADFATDAIKGKLDPPDDDNVMTGVNVLSIVIEINLGRLYRNTASLVAVAAETTTRDFPGAALRRLDRVGRPEITNVSLAAHQEPDLRDRYNLDRPFQVPPEAQRLYQNRIARNIASYDRLDGRKDWQDRDRDAVAALMADDFLIVDMSKPCQGSSFLEIEKAALRHRGHATCGGRKPNDDIMDTLFTLYVAGMDGKPVRDGVNGPATPVSAAFPYLAAPDLGFWSSVRAFVARKILGIPDLR